MEITFTDAGEAQCAHLLVIISNVSKRLEPWNYLVVEHRLHLAGRAGEKKDGA